MANPQRAPTCRRRLPRRLLCSCLVTHWFTWMPHFAVSRRQSHLVIILKDPQRTLPLPPYLLLIPVAHGLHSQAVITSSVLYGPPQVGRENAFPPSVPHTWDSMQQQQQSLKKLGLLFWSQQGKLWKCTLVTCLFYPVVLALCAGRTNLCAKHGRCISVKQLSLKNETMRLDKIPCRNEERRAFFWSWWSIVSPKSSWSTEAATGFAGPLPCLYPDAWN